MNFSQISPQSQYHTQANAFPSQLELSNWTKASYKEKDQPAHDKTEEEKQTQ
jgi:hypothetical protein